jgi:hypothetical protein
MATATRDAIAQKVIETLASFGDDAASIVTVADTIDLVIARLR